MTEPLHRPALILVDGHSLAYRQFHALPPDKFSTRDGLPTNAIYGFARTLLDLLDLKPEYLAVSFDQGLSGRELLYPEYKGTRDKMSDLLSMQLGYIRELVEAFNIPILEFAGGEADDVIGSTTRQAEASNVETYILTGDHDLMQLITDHVLVWLPPTKTQSGLQLYDAARVMAEKGVPPVLIPDWKGMVGDTSDNIPGVRGVGEKTASTLLQTYGSLRAVYDHLDEQKEKLREKLETGRESAFLSKNLATIRIDVPITLDLPKCVAHDYDRQTVADLFRRLEFRSLSERLPPAAVDTADSAPVADVVGEGDPDGLSADPVITANGSAPTSQSASFETVIVDSLEALADLISVLEAAPTIAFDTETTGLNAFSDALVGISLAVSAERGYYLPVGHINGGGMFDTTPHQLPLRTVIDALTPTMTDPAKPKWAHNAAFDLLVLHQHGLTVAPITFDTMVAEWVLNPDSRHKGLKDQAALRLGVEMTPITALIGKGKRQITMDRVAIEQTAPYAAADAVMSYRLVAVMRAELEAIQMLNLFETLEMPLIPVLIGMQLAGARIDVPYLRHLSLEMRQRQDDLQKQIYEAAGYTFNLNSLRDLNKLLFDTLHLSAEGLGKTQHGYSLDAGALEQLSEQHAIVRLLLNWRGLEKLRSTYVDALPTLADSNDRVHTSYNQVGATTGRMSSENPNLQNIPIRSEEGRRVRQAFIAAPGCHLLSIDYSQIELRILAHYSHEPFMIDSFASGQDIHTATAAAVLNVPYSEISKEQRYQAKRVNFGLMYGMGAFRLSKETDMSVGEATRFIERYFARLPNIQRYLQSSKDLAAQRGYLETMFGRRRYFRLLQQTGADRVSAVLKARIEREAINMPIQGTNADIIKRAMIVLPQKLREAGFAARLILQVHDELVLEVPDAEIYPVTALVQQVMESAATLDVPLATEAKVGLNWAEMTPVEVAGAAG